MSWNLNVSRLLPRAQEFHHVCRSLLPGLEEGSEGAGTVVAKRLTHHEVLPGQSRCWCTSTRKRHPDNRMKALHQHSSL